MEKELGSDVIKSTQAALGKYVKRPPLSEKLLRKPPFRFLHDIVTAVSIDFPNPPIRLEGKVCTYLPTYLIRMYLLGTYLI